MHLGIFAEWRTVCFLSFLAVLAWLGLRFGKIVRGSRAWGKKRTRPLSTMIVLGSGGHTAEMLTLVENLNLSGYQPRCYVVSATDTHSAKKAIDLEKKVSQANGGFRAAVDIATIPRSREVGQSYITSVWTTAWACAWAFALVCQHRPHLVVANGPGTCVPICLSAFALRVLGLSDSRVVYVESIARVRTLSLSGRILYGLRAADKFVVQWPRLRDRFPRAEYHGRLY
mmetsp:Transcript_2281/g.5378  ORF Transcript_2281/g.5378 Transcript_2281/m.5378 type:complete len:228 (+) Transcript_2281:157-840(+)